MKKIALQISLVILATCPALFTKPQSASAQVDMSLLTDAAQSCQKDTKSSEYYKQMWFDDDMFTPLIGLDTSLKDCIEFRYHYSLVQSKFPWLASTGEMIQGYPGFVLVSTIAYYHTLSPGLNNSSLLDCIASGDPSNEQCTSSVIRSLFYDHKINKYSVGHLVSQYYIYVCPSCIVAHDNVMSEKSMRGSFIQWFLSLDKPTRRKVMSILGEGQKAEKNRSEMATEANRAVSEYIEIRQKVEQQEQERRRREVIGN